MTEFLSLTIAGLVVGCVYAIAASGLVVTYTTSGVFNFAHGAIGMLGAFLFWQLVVQWHLPVVLGVVLVLFGAMPLVGAGVERLLIRSLEGAALKLSPVVTLGLMLFLVGMATTLWDPQTARVTPRFFASDQVTIFHTVVSWHELTIAVCAVLVAVALRVFLFHTRTGVTMRATVDDRALVGLTGARATRYSQLGWMLGAVLAGLAGILISPLVNLDVQTLTLLVVNAYAAAVLGRLRSLPLTFTGGIMLGLITSYAIGYLPVGAFLSELGPVIPIAFLFVLLLGLPERRLERLSQSIVLPRIVGGRESVVRAVIFVAVASALSFALPASDLETAGYGLGLALILLSFVPLTGYAGQLSLCQFTFAGIGGVVMSKVAGGGSVLGLLVAVVAAGAVGALVSLPALRLRGLYLALATLAFAEAMDSAFFNNSSVMGINGAVPVGRIGIGGLSLASDRSYFVLLCVVFAAAGVGLCALRRSRPGRYLFAMNDSEVAATTFGMNLTLVKVAVFAGSAAFAGLAGALYGGEQHLVGPSDFQLLMSLTGLLIVTVTGVRTVSGALMGAIGLAVMPVIQAHVPVLHDFTYLGVGLAAIAISQNPNGDRPTPLSAWRKRRAGRLQVSVPVPIPARADAAIVPTVPAAKGRP